jgi:hypothetical protein
MNELINFIIIVLVVITGQNYISFDLYECYSPIASDFSNSGKGIGNSNIIIL